jgi:hypothetical protein
MSKLHTLSWNFLGAEKTDANQKHGAHGRPTFELLLEAAQAHAAHAKQPSWRPGGQRCAMKLVMYSVWGRLQANSQG